MRGPGNAPRAEPVNPDHSEVPCAGPKHTLLPSAVVKCKILAVDNQRSAAAERRAVVSPKHHTSQVAEAYGFHARTCDAGYLSPRTSAEKVTQGFITGPFVVLELFMRALWGWFLPLLAAQAVYYKWKKEMIWDGHI